MVERLMVFSPHSSNQYPISHVIRPFCDLFWIVIVLSYSSDEG